MRYSTCQAAMVASMLLAGSDSRAQTAPAPVLTPAQDAAAAALTNARVANESAQARYYAKQADTEPSGTPVWLQTVIGGLLAIGGSFSTLLLTTWLAERKATEVQGQTYRRHQLQLQLAAKELDEALEKLRLPPMEEGAEGERLLAWANQNIVQANLPAWVSEDVLYEEPTRPTASRRDDPYYLKYDLVDCIYRLSALLGWLELYRTDGTFLRGPSTRAQQRIEGLFSEIRMDLADPLQSVRERLEKVTLNMGEWRDGFILDEDQRAIGEKMIDRLRSGVIGYAEFGETLFRSPKRGAPTNWDIPTSQNWWIWNATRFVCELNSRPTVAADGHAREELASPTFGLIRVSRLRRHCAELVKLLEA